MELGPIQKQWVANLRAYPERQYKGSLGQRTLEVSKQEVHPYRACCLGEGYLTVKRAEGVDVMQECFTSEGWLFIPEENSHRNFYVLSEGGSGLGLFDIGGAFQDEDGETQSLAELNDKGKTWPQIADIIEKYKDQLFKESV